MYGFDCKYKARSFFIVPRLSTEIHLSIQGLLIVIGKPIRSTGVGIVKHYWTSIDSGAIGNIFYMHAALFEIQK